MNKRISLGLAVGVLWGIYTLMIGLTASFFGYGSELVGIIGTLYIGYNATVLGAFIGMIWGFVDGFVVGYLIEMLFSYFNRVKTSKQK